MNELIRFLKKPALDTFPDYGLKGRIKCFLSAYLFCIIFIILSGIVIILTEHILTHSFHILSPQINYNKMMQRVSGQYKGYRFLVVALVAPIYEELMFRLYLNLKKITVAISFSLLVYGLMGPIWTTSGPKSMIWRIAIVILLFVLIQIFIRKEFLLKLKENSFMYVYYFSVLLFGLLHISNFSPLDKRILFLYPLLVLPQIGMGLSLGYIRVRIKHGIYWAILLHIFLNLQGILFHLA